MARRKRKPRSSVRRLPAARPALAGAGAGTVAQAAPRPSLWILDSWRDLALFVGTPLLIYPLFTLARQQWSVQEIYLFVAAFGALGHHVPGMLRAYGDRELFRRFKTRFIIAPIFLAAVCTLFAVRDMGGMVLIAALWGVWHGLAQTYGFLRIYDSKRGSFAKLTAQLDRAMCVAWFGAGLVLSPGRMHDLLDRLYRQIGIAPLPDAFIPALRGVWMWGTAAVTAAFLVHTAVSWRRGHPPSPIKLLLMVTSFGFWWFACVTVDNMLVGVALFEVFHDVQYLSIVWIFNRNRVEKSDRLGGFMSFLFRRSGALIGLYVGLVFAYGSISYVSRGMPTETLKEVLKGLIVASALLHFYYDGFIWKVRERSTRESLGLKGGRSDAGGSRRLRPGTLHALYWAPLVLAIGWLGVTEASAGPRGRSDLVIAQALTTALPDSARAHAQLGEALVDVGRLDEAAEAFSRSLELGPDVAETHYGFARAWAEKGDQTQELFHLEETLRLEPDHASAHNDLSLVWAARGEFEKELHHLEQALRLEPDYAEAHNNMGVVLASRGEFEEAIEHFEAAIRLEPADAGAHNNLGLALAGVGRLEEAIVHFRRALEIRPGLAEAERALRAAQQAASRPEKQSQRRTQ